MNKDLFFITFIASIGGAIVGIDISLLHVSFPYFKGYFELTNSGEVLTSVAVSLGAVMGAFYFGQHADKHGRRDTMKLTAIVFIISSIGSAFSTNYSIFVLFRLIAGIGIGSLTVVVPVYLAEIAPHERRGRVMLIFPISVMVGLMIGNLTGLMTNDVNANNWRWMFLLMLIPILTFLALLFTTIRSPRWTMQRGYDRETSFVLRLLNPKADIDLMMSEIKDTFPYTSHKSGRHGGRGTSLISGWWIALMIIMVFSQMTGAAFITSSAQTYVRHIFQSGDLIVYGDSLTTLLQFLALILVFRVYDKSGRITYLRFGLVGMIASLVVLSIFHFLPDGNLFVKWIATEIYLVCFTMSVGSLIFVYIPEAVTNKNRGTQVGFLFSIYWAIHLVIFLAAPFIFKWKIGGVTTLLFAGISILALFLLPKLVRVETTNRSLEELDRFIRTQP